MLSRALVGLGVLLLGCGARSTLLPGETDDEPGTTSTTSSSGSGGGSTTPSLPPCRPIAAGSAAEIISFPDRHGIAPSAVVIPGTSPERLFVQTFASGGDSSLHSDIELSELRVGSAWPAGVSTVAGPALFGFEAHGWAVMTHSPPSRNELALGWHGDPGGFSRPIFRRLDLGTNGGLATVDIAQSAEALLDLVPSDSGYAAVWRGFADSSGTLVSPTVALLDLDGNRVAGPAPLTFPRDYPGRSATLTWTGSSFLAAVAFGLCEPGEEALCRPHSVVVTRLAPGTAAPSIAASFELGMIDDVTWASPSRPFLASYGGRTYLAWSEGSTDFLAGRRLRVAELAGDGQVRAGPIDAEQAIEMLSRPTLVASEAGVTLVWTAPGDRGLPENAPGHDRLVMTQLDVELDVLTSRASIGIPAFNDYGPPHGVALAEPRALFFVVSARLAKAPGYDGVFGARFDCK